MKKILQNARAALLLALLLTTTAADAQRKEGTWVEPVAFFHLDKKGDPMDMDAIAAAMWEKERYIMGFKASVCNFTPVGNKPEDANVPYSPLTFYVYLNQPTTISVTSDWRGLENGQWLGVYQTKASEVLFTYDQNSHTYAFDYTPEGSYDYDGRASYAVKNNIDISEHRAVVPGKTDMALFYTKRGGLRGYYGVTLLAHDEEDGDSEETHYVQFKVEEVLLDGDVKELSEEDREKLIEQMDDLTKALKEYIEGTGDHTGPVPTTIINMIGTIGSVLLANGISSVTGSGVGIFGGGGGSAPSGGGSPMPDGGPTGADTPTQPNVRREEDEEPKPEPEPKPEDPLGENRKYWDHYMRENEDGTLTMKDPISGKPLTYYPKPDGTYESEMGTTYTKEDLAENVRYRAENSGYFKDVADKAAADVKAQREQNERINAETDARGQAYRAQKAAEEAERKDQEEKEKAQLERLAKKYGVEAERDAVIEALYKDQFNAEQDYKESMAEAKYLDRVTNTLEVVDNVATTSINILGECVPGGGRAIKNIYTMAHSITSNCANAAARGEDTTKAAFFGAIDGGLGIMQNQAGNITNNAWVEGVMVVGGEGLKEGFKSIANGDDPATANDKMLQGMAHKLNYFLMGKSVENKLGWVNKSAEQSLANGGVSLAEDTGLRFSEGAAKAINKALSNENATKGIVSAVQEVGADYTGNWGRDSKVDGIIHDVGYFTDLVKDFSNAAAKAKNK